MSSAHRAGPAGPARRSGDAAALRHVLTHLITPLLMCVGMGFAYLGAFAHPSPHHLPVAVVGSGPSAQVLAQTINDKSGGDLTVRTVADRGEAVRQLKERDVFGAYVPGGAGGARTGSAGGAAGAGGVADAGGVAGPGGGAPELLVATAGSDTTASVVQKVFTPVAAERGAPLKVTDVVPTAPGDPTGQGLFFLLVAVSIGSYASVAVLGGAGAALPMRLRALLAAGVSLVVSVIGTLFAGPVFHLVDHGLWGVWGLAWLYSAGIVLIGVGLHVFLKRWTTLGVMVLFVMLNFTSAGGVFRPELQNGFFAALHAFWNGAGFLEGTRGLVYFDGAGLGGHVWTLALWLVAALAVLGAGGAAESRRAAGTASAGAGGASAGGASVGAAGAVSGDSAEAAEEGSERARGGVEETREQREQEEQEEREEEMEEAVGV
ncbi:ABC transporter permease [Streptomyces varsoviensis]|uniref:ABC transporter permease n=1 Tax=Streptomyces varsoviensis TaxID=67373 RepID=UPI0033D80058